MTTMRIVRRLMVPAIMGVAVVSMTAATTAAASATLLPGAAGKPGIVAHERSLGPLGPLTDLVIQRLLVGDQVAAAKFGTGRPIDDPVREKQELAAVRQSALSLGINPDAAVSFFGQQINASKVVQRGLFDRWTAHPDQAPTSRPDLGTIRTELDQLTTELLQQLVAQQPVLSHEFACRIDLSVASATGELLNHLDALHRHALQVALSQTCTGW
jgi:chorismate mutase-like protein